MTTNQENGQAVIEYGVTEAALAALTEKNKDLTECTAENYDTIKANATELQKLRAKVETKRNELLTEARDYTQNVNDLAKSITASITAIEEPVKKLKTDYDAEQKRIKDAAKLKEQERTDKINAAIDAIEGMGRDLESVTASDLSDRLSDVRATQPTEEVFQEFHAVALERHESTIARLTVAHGKAVAAELEAQKLKEAQDKLAKDQAEAAAAQKVIDDANAAAQKKLDDDREAFRKEQEEAKEKADAAADAEKREAAEAAQKEADKEAEADREAREKEIAEQAAQAGADAAIAAQAEAEAAEAEKLALAPDKDKLIHYAGTLEAFMEAAPELANDKARKVLARAMTGLKNVHGSLVDTAERL